MSGSVAEIAERVETETTDEQDPRSETPDRDPAEVFAERDRGIPGGEVEEIEESPKSWTGRLMEPLDGSIQQDRVGELWDRDNGGLNRLALVAEETAGLGDGLPRAVHLVIGLAEAYLNLAEHADAPEQDETGDVEEQSLPGDTAEVVNYEP